MPRSPLPPLASLRAFEAVARQGSFRRAAQDLNITQSAISHQIANLEAFLEVRLFKRSPKRIELTEAGAQYFPFLRDAFERIAQGTALVARGAATRNLTLQVYVTVAVRWLIPRMTKFQKLHPDIVIRLNASHLDWAFDPDSSDVGFIYSATPLPAGLHGAHLFNASLSPVCSPALMRSAASIKRPEDLANHTLLVLFTSAEDWRVWFAAAGLPDLTTRSAPKFDSYLLALEAAADGQGVAIAPDFLVTADLRSGRLVKPFEIQAPQPGAWYLACRSERARDPSISRFRDWLKAEIAGDARADSAGEH